LPSLEKRLPLDDEAYKIAVQSLAPLKGHIEGLSGAEEIAEKLRQRTLEPFRFLEAELSGYRQCTPGLMFGRLGHDQAGVQDSALSVDVRITEVENEPGKSNHNLEKGQN